MRRFFSIIMSLLIVLLLTACKADGKKADEVGNIEDQEDNSSCVSENKNELYRPHQKLTKTEAPFNINEMMRFSIPDVGLENVLVESMTAAAELDENTYGQVYLFADDRYGGQGMPADHYLAVVLSNKIIVKDTSKRENQACYGGTVELGDLDGDGDSEILLQEIVGATGGAGSYISRVFDFKNSEITEVFSSENPQKESDTIDTGFSIEILKDKKFKIKNSITGYSEVFELSERKEQYYKDYWYDENGTPNALSILVDSFCEFYAKDVDNDGIYEIACKQYVSLVGHSDFIGWATTVLKYNKASGTFVIVESGFEAN